MTVGHFDLLTLGHRVEDEVVLSRLLLWLCPISPCANKMPLLKEINENHINKWWINYEFS
jgi:hypothetical protein